MPCANAVTSAELVPAAASTASIAARTPSDWSAGVVGAFAVVVRSVHQDGVREGPSDVDPEQHGAER